LPASKPCTGKKEKRSEQGLPKYSSENASHENTSRTANNWVLYDYLYKIHPLPLLSQVFLS